MLPTTREWVSKAESDYDVVLLLRRSRKPSRYDPLCFHAQQCIEKYLKSRLTEAGLPFPKTHDLPVLLQLCIKLEPLWIVWLTSFKSITGLAILPRYPGMTTTRFDAAEAFTVCEKFRKIARSSLGLSK